MEISPFIVYLITRLDSANSVILTALTILIIMAIALTITLFISFLTSSFLTDDEDDVVERCSKLASFLNLKPIIIVMLILSIIHIILPTSKQACAIIIVPAIANSQIVQQTLPRSLEHLVKLADEYFVNLLSEQTDKAEHSPTKTKTP